MFDRWLVILILFSLIIFGIESRCGDRLERALGMMQQRGNTARRRYEVEDPDVVYHQRLHTAPIDISVTKLMIEIPHSSSRDGLSWAKVERCAYEPNNNSIRSRVTFNELAVTGLVQLVAYDVATTKTSEWMLPAEACRVNLRLRRAGMEFYTSPIARGRGQMRIRTESSFLEPRFASIYAYGCKTMVMPEINNDRIFTSKPRKREVVEASTLVDLETSGDSNTVSNSSALEDEDAIQEENRLNGSPVPISSKGTANDVLLDSLWRSRGDIAREMEDVFLRSASQAITHYIEKQLHPAIKETLMLSMGYTISYG